jgi:hypothetical protein
MAPALGQLAASTFEKVAGAGPEDNVFTSQFLLWMLKRGKGFRKLDGGQLIEESLEYAENTTFRSYSDLETLDTTRIDVFDAARFNWKEVGGTIVFSNLEKMRNQGESAKFDLVAKKVNNGKNSMFAAINRMLYSDGTGNSSKDITGLAALVSSTPTSGTVGGINRGTFSFWRNRQALGTLGSVAFDNLRGAMRTIYNQCSKGAFDEHPEAYVMSRTDFQGFESTLVVNERFTDSSKDGVADGGFKNEMLKFKGARVAFDEDCTAGTAYCLNSRNLKLNYPSGGWAKTFDTVEPANQTAEVVKIATIAQTSINNPRRLGVITVIT